MHNQYNNWCEEIKERDRSRSLYSRMREPDWWDRACVAIPLIFFVMFGIPSLLGLALWLLGYSIMPACILWALIMIVVVSIGAGAGCP